jgi:hypothetical protein
MPLEILLKLKVTVITPSATFHGLSSTEITGLSASATGSVSEYLPSAICQLPDIGRQPLATPSSKPSTKVPADARLQNKKPQMNRADTNFFMIFIFLSRLRIEILKIDL